MSSSITFDLKGETAFITGATSGFGVRFAEVLSDAGATVVITGRRVERLKALKEKIESRGGRAVPLALDVTKVEQIRACVAEGERLAGPIGILVNNAGLNVQSSASALSEADYDTIMTPEPATLPVVRLKIESSTPPDLRDFVASLVPPACHEMVFLENAAVLFRVG